MRMREQQMVARFLGWLLIGQMLVIGLIAGSLALLAAWPWWLAGLTGMSLMLLIRIWITGQNFFLAWYYRSPKPEQAKLSPWQAVRLFFGEFYATLISSSWLMWRQAFAERQPSSAKHGLPILLIHGYGCNSGYWVKMSARLEQAGYHHYALDLEPILADIDSYVPLLKQKLEAICQASGHNQVIILAHSMGGLVTRCYLRQHGAARIAHVITLGTPHHGTGLANFGPGPNCRQMAWRKRHGASPWLSALQQSENAQIRALFTSIYSHHDNIVSPQTSSELADAKNIALAGIGHVALALHPQVQDCVLRELALVQERQMKARPA